MGEEPTCNAGDTGGTGLIPWLGRSLGEGHGNLLQYSCLENSHGQRSLAGYSPWGHKESDGTEVTEHSSCSFPSRVPSGCTVGVAAAAEGLGVGSLFVFIPSFLKAHTWGSGSG